MRIVAAALIVATLGAAGCKNDKKYNSFVSPEAGATMPEGSEIRLKIDFAGKPDSTVYYLDSTRVAAKKDTGAIDVPGRALMLGSHVVSAKIYEGGKEDEVTTNVVVLPAKAPDTLSYVVVNTFPHDTTSFTEGLEYRDGVIYESDGMNGESSIRIADLRTGKVLKKNDMSPEDFAEGLAVVGDEIIQLTYQQNKGYRYDRKTLAKRSEFPYTVGREGWGLYYDGTKLLATDGSSTIFFIDPATMQRIGSIDVYDNRGAVDSLNELELIDGKIYANIWMKNIVVVIDPKTGAVESVIDFTALEKAKNKSGDVLNGIAWDKAGRRMFVTGKKWDKLYEVRITK